MGQLSLSFFTAVQKQRFWMPINVEHFLNIWHGVLVTQSHSLFTYPCSFICFIPLECDASAELTSSL